MPAFSFVFSFGNHLALLIFRNCMVALRFGALAD
jgi:hypothetical protein